MKDTNFKTVKKPFEIKDKWGGFHYTVVATSRTHYQAVDGLGVHLTVHKNQAVKVPTKR